jgi:hypothetical protein
MVTIVFTEAILRQTKETADQILMYIVRRVHMAVIADFVLLWERLVVVVLAIFGSVGGPTAAIELTIRGLQKLPILTAQLDFKELR